MCCNNLYIFFNIYLRIVDDMTITIYVLIILGSNTSAATTQEFRTKESCLYAKQQVEQYIGAGNHRYNAICTPIYKDTK